MFFRMLELVSAPFLLLLISHNSENKPPGNTKLLTSTPAPEVNDVSQCLSFSERSVDVLFYDHPDPKIRGCYEKDTNGPCGENMRLYPINGTRNGECDCSVSSLRILLFHNETNRCYPIFNQAYCENGEQLVITRERPLMPVCQRTACYEQLKDPQNMGKDLVPIRNNTACVEVGRASTCNRGFVIGFERNKVEPYCTNPRARAIGVPPVRCSPGTYRAITGDCQPPVFSFDDWD